MIDNLFLAMTPRRVRWTWALAAAASWTALSACVLWPAWREAQDPRVPAEQEVQSQTDRLRTVLLKLAAEKRALTPAEPDGRSALAAARRALADAGLIRVEAGPPAHVGLRLSQSRMQALGTYAALVSGLEAVELTGPVRLRELVLVADPDSGAVRASWDLVWLEPVGRVGP